MSEIREEKTAATRASRLRAVAEWVEKHPQYAPFMMMVSMDSKISLYGYTTGLEELIPWDKVKLGKPESYGYVSISWEEGGQTLTASVKPPAEVSRAHRIAHLREELAELEGGHAADHG